MSSTAANKFAEALLYPMWDATLAVGHQVLSAAEAVALGQTDLATGTALLDLRRLAGDDRLVREMVARAFEGLFGEEPLAGFIQRLEEEAAARHDRFGGSVYLLEPDVKSGAGGLRNLDGLRWAARARYRVGERADGRKLGVWGELVRMGVLVAREASGIGAAEEFLGAFETAFTLAPGAKQTVSGSRSKKRWRSRWDTGTTGRVPPND